MTPLSTPTPHSPNCCRSSSSISSISSRTCSEGLCSILKEVSKMTLLEGKHHQEHQQYHQLQHQNEASPSPFSINLSFNISGCFSAVETPVSRKSERVRTSWTPPPVVVAKTEQHESSTSQAYIITPFDTTPSNTTKMKTNFLGRKRQRPCYNCNITRPPMIPGSPELDDTADSNPFGRHVAMYSPIAGLTNTLNLGCIANLKSSKWSHSPELQRVVMPPPCPMKVTGHTTRSCSSSSTPSSSSSSSEEINRMQTYFPILDDPYESNDVDSGEGNRGEHDIGIATRALKMRRRCRKDNPYDIFDATLFTI
jgi:hypothetical protein